MFWRAKCEVDSQDYMVKDYTKPHSNPPLPIFHIDNKDGVFEDEASELKTNFIKSL